MASVLSFVDPPHGPPTFRSNGNDGTNEFLELTYTAVLTYQDRLLIEAGYQLLEYVEIFGYDAQIDPGNNPYQGLGFIAYPIEAIDNDSTRAQILALQTVDKLKVQRKKSMKIARTKLIEDTDNQDELICRITIAPGFMAFSDILSLPR